MVLNNLSDQGKDVSLDMPRAKAMTIRRFGRNADQTPYRREGPLASARALSLEGRETAVIRADYGKALAVPVESGSDAGVKNRHPEVNFRHSSLWGRGSCSFRPAPGTSHRGGMRGSPEVWAATEVS